MASGSQKFIARNRAPRVQIEYDVELYGSEKKVQLPFVMGVMADLAGKSAVAQPAIADRRFLEIDVDNFDERMRAMAPRASFAVPNTLTGEGNLSVDLTFESMNDFTPGAVAARIGPLRALLEARTQLSNLLTYMDGKTGAEELIERLLGDPALLAAVVSAPAPAPAGDGEETGVLDALRTAAPDAAPAGDGSADVLAALRASAPEPGAEDRTADDALAGLRAAAPAEAAEDTTTEDTLAGLRHLQPRAAEETDPSADILAGLAATPEVAAEADTTDALLAGLAAGADEAAAEADDISAILGDLATTPEAEAEADPSADILAGLAATPEVAAEADTTDALLAGLAAGADEAAAEADDTDAILGDLATTPEAEADADPSADILAGLAATPEVAEAPDTTDALLAGLAAGADEVAAEADDTDAILGDLATTPEAEADADPSADILAGLAATPEVAEAPDTTDALLAGLAAGADEVAAEADDTAAILGDLATTPEAEADADPSADILAGLAATPEVAAAPDTTDALLAGLAAGADELAAEADDTDALLAGLAGLDETDTGRDPDALLAGDDGDAALDALLGAIPDATGPDATGPDAAVPGGAGSDLDALLADDDGDAALNALLAAGGEDAGGAPDEPAGSDPAGTDTNTDAALAALLGGNDGDAGLDALLGAVDDAPGSDLDALLTGDDDLDALLAGTLDGDTAIGGDDGASLSDAPDGAGDTDLDALLAGDDDAGLDALLGAIGSDEDMPAPAAEGEANETEDEMSAIPGDGAGDERKVDQPFGFISAPRPAPEDLRRTGFRMAIFGDFTGRAARGLIETGDALAARRAIPLDVDTVEEVIEGFATDLVLPVGPDGAGIRVSLKELDALHPDELFDNVEIFAGISGLRQRLKSASLAPAALDQLRKWGEAHGQRLAPPRRKSAGSSVPANLKLGAFQQLIGDSGGRLTQASPIDDMVARIIGPHVVEAPNPDAAAMLTAVDDALSSAMRLILHHPEFQSVEALWRSLDFLARRIETDTKLTIDLYDVSAEELAVDLAAGDDLSESGLLKLLADRPLGEEGPGGYSALFGLYTFEETPPHAELLARVAQVAAHVDAPFFTAISPGFLDVAKEDRHPLVAKAWDTLRGLPEAAYLGIASPRFLLRRPYGQRTEPVDAFDFEEFTESEGLSGMLWANPVLLVAVLLGAGWSKHGKEMSLGSVMSINDIPFHFVRDRHGDQVALPHTERNLTTSKVRDVVTRGFQPVLSIRGRDEIRLGSFQSLAGEEIRGRWTGVPMPPKAPLPVTPAAAARPADIEMEIAAPGDDGGADLDALLAGLGSDAGEGEGGDADLDALLAGLGGADDTGGDDADLDALLAGFDDAGTGPSDDGGMDPELAALLEGL